MPYVQRPFVRMTCEQATCGIDGYYDDLDHARFDAWVITADGRTFCSERDAKRAGAIPCEHGEVEQRAVAEWTLPALRDPKDAAVLHVDWPVRCTTCGMQGRAPQQVRAEWHLNDVKWEIRVLREVGAAQVGQG